jgi:hypothetical protein
MAVLGSNSKKPFEYSIPPQGKRKKPIKITLTFSESDKERDEILDKQILKTVFGR